MSYHYKIFGFSVLSDMLLDCYSDTFEKADIHIIVGKLPPERVPANTMGGIFIQPKWCLFSVPEVAHFYITDGNRILIEPLLDENHLEIQLYLFGTAFGFLMMQRGEFPLHGSALSWRDKGIVIVGHSGAGKTSLAGGLVNLGAKIITDDVSRMLEHHGGFAVSPSYPSQKMWSETAIALGIPNQLGKAVANRMDKYYVNEPTRFAKEFVHVDAIIELAPMETSEVSLERCNQLNSMKVLIEHTYRYEYMRDEEYLKQHFKFIAKLASAIPVYRLSRPMGSFTVERQIQLIGDGIY